MAYTAASLHAKSFWWWQRSVRYCPPPPPPTFPTSCDLGPRQYLSQDNSSLRKSNNNVIHARSDCRWLHGQLFNFMFVQGDCIPAHMQTHSLCGSWSVHQSDHSAVLSLRPSLSSYNQQLTNLLTVRPSVYVPVRPPIRSFSPSLGLFVCLNVSDLYWIASHVSPDDPVDQGTEMNWTSVVRLNVSLFVCLSASSDVSPRCGETVN